MKNFFISYNKADRAWAEWIAWVLEEAGYTVVIQAWDFRPGENFALRMQDAAKGTRQTIAVLSDAYLAALFTQAEWAAAFARDPTGDSRTLVPIRVSECKPEGILGPTIYIDLVGLPEEQARTRLVDGIANERAKPDIAPPFPTRKAAGSQSIADNHERPQYPGVVHDNEGSAGHIPSNVPTGIPFFTGREDVLSQLETALKSTGSAALGQRQAISGLGGVGKTQTALEYARRHRREYSAVLWAVAQSKESLMADFVAIANTLKLPEANVTDQAFVVARVKHWLRKNSDWLLILDNADDPTVVEEFLPEQLGGHLIVTSRAQVFDVVGILNPVELEEMSPGDAAEFLLKRTGRANLSSEESEAVNELAREVDYLPLALEQAGAYIKELRSSFRDYLASYYRRGLELLERGHATGKYGKSVRTTWSLNFRQVEEMSIASADVLRLSAFLSPDRIPYEILSEARAELGPDISVTLATVNSDPLCLDELLQPLIQYSLIHRDRPSRTYDIHRLVQAVLKDGMNIATRFEWSTRLVRALASIFPDADPVAFSDSPKCERLLPHALACVLLISSHSLESAEAERLLMHTGRYLHYRGRLSEAEPLYRAASRLRNTRDADPLDSVVSLRKEALLCFDQGNYDDAERLCNESLSAAEKALGSSHTAIADILIVLGRVYGEQGRFSDSSRAIARSTEILTDSFGADSQETAASLSWLAIITLRRGNRQDAEAQAERALKIKDPDDKSTNNSITNDLYTLARIRIYQRRFAEAEALLLRAIAIVETTFGPNYPRLATYLAEFADLRIAEEKYSEAEPVIQRALRLVEEGLGPDHPETGTHCDLYARFCHHQGNYDLAEKFFLRALTIAENTGGRNNFSFALSQHNLARLYLDQKKYALGEPLVRTALPILKKSYGSDNQNVVNALVVHGMLLKGLNRKGEAQEVQAQARKIQARLDKARKKLK